MDILSRTMAIMGGIVLCLLVLLTCLSVAGRGLNTLLHGMFGDIFPDFSTWLLDLGVGPINGDFELVEAGVAFAIFASLPYCQFKSSHAVVDVFANFLGEKANRFLLMVSEFLFAAVLVLITVQLYGGMQAKRQFGETTFLLQFPIWWAYGVSLLAAVIASLVAIYMAFVRANEFFTGEPSVTHEPEFDL